LFDLFRKVLDDWLDGGGEIWELIEPVDSLHPTQKAQGTVNNNSSIFYPLSPSPNILTF
jgi:hypothetical protein